MSDATQDFNYLHATAYEEVWVVVDGALEEEQTFFDYALRDDYIRQIEEEAADHGYPTQVYIRYHEHAPNLDCECAQYEQSHEAAYSFNQS